MIKYYIINILIHSPGLYRDRRICILCESEDDDDGKYFIRVMVLTKRNIKKNITRSFFESGFNCYSGGLFYTSPPEFDENDIRELLLSFKINYCLVYSVSTIKYYIREITE